MEKSSLDIDVLANILHFVSVHGMVIAPAMFCSAECWLIKKVQTQEMKLRK